MQHVEGKRRGQRFPGKQAFLFTELNHQPQISNTKRHTTHMDQFPVDLTSFKDLELNLFGLRVAMSKNPPTK